MINKKKFVAVITVILLLIPSFRALTESNNISQNGSGMDQTLAESECKLLLDEESGEFSVLTNDGFAWQSSPVLGDFDRSASGAERTNQRSVLLISYLDAEGNVSETSSYVSSLKKDGMSVKKTQNGAVLTFDFPDIGITVPITLTCTNACFEANIKSAEVKETGENRLLTVSILPYFGAGSVSESGYLLIPDGSGALISLNSTNAYEKTYEKAVYGENPVLYKTVEKTVEQQIYMPIFGVKRGNNAMLAVIDQGDSFSSITANATTNYYTASAKFTYRQVDTSHLMEGSAKEKVVYIAPKTHTSSDFSVQYIFLQGDQANYIGMAACYRNYLIKKYGSFHKSKSDGISLDVSLTATAETDKSFLGIPYKGLTTFTTFSDTEEIIDVFRNENINNYNMSLIGAFAGGNYGKVPNKVKITGKVGSIRDYEKLNSKIGAGNNKLFLLTNFQRAYKTGNGVSKTFGTARDVSGAIKKKYEFYPENFAEKSDHGWYFLNASAMDKVVGRFVKTAKRYPVNLGLFNMANELYGDYRLNAISDRADILEAQTTAFENLYKSFGGIYFQSANIYAIKYAHMISDVPTCSSRHDLFTEDVPFYQAVIHGITDYSCFAVNLSGEKDKALLKAIEYGSAIRYDLVCRNVEEIYKSSANYLISADKDVWMDTIKNTDKNISEFYRRNAGSTITAHIKIADDVYKTVYSNGSASVVNYSNQEIVIDGATVESNGYLFFSEGE